MNKMLCDNRVEITKLKYVLKTPILLKYTVVLVNTIEECYTILRYTCKYSTRFRTVHNSVSIG